jgi:putative transposase
MVSFIDAHRETHWVESICRQLPISPSMYYEAKARQASPSRLPPRVRRDAELLPAIQRMFEENFRVYGARKVWRQLNQEHWGVARYTVERLMARLGLYGAIRGGKKWCTTIPDTAAARPADLVNRRFQAERPNRRCDSWCCVVVLLRERHYRFRSTSGRVQPDAAQHGSPYPTHTRSS